MRAARGGPGQRRVRGHRERVRQVPRQGARLHEQALRRRGEAEAGLDGAGVDDAAATAGSGIYVGGCDAEAPNKESKLSIPTELKGGRHF